MSRFREFLDRLSERDRRALLLGATITIPVLLWIGAVRPYRAALTDARERVAAERSLLARERALIADADNLPALLHTAAAGAERALRRLIDAPSAAAAEAEITDYLESSAAKSRVLLEEIRGVAPGRRDSSPDGLQPIRLAVSGESDLKGIASLLRRIEEGALLLRVSELAIEPGVERTSTGSQRGGTARPTPTGYLSFTMTVEAWTPLEANAAVDAAKEPAS